MGMQKEPFTFKCHTCGKETEWKVIHMLVDYHGLVHGYECTECGRKVPSFAMERYQQTGKVLIPV